MSPLRTQWEGAPAGELGSTRAHPAVHTAAGGGGMGEGGPLPQCAPPPKPVCPDGERGRRARAGCACAPPPGAIKASPPAATSASSCPEKPIHLLQRQLLWTWTLRPALALLVSPRPQPPAQRAPDLQRIPRPTDPLKDIWGKGLFAIFNLVEGWTWLYPRGR